MSQPSDNPKLDPAQRAKTLISYLEEKCNLPDDIPDHLKLKVQQAKIETCLIEMEKSAQELAGEK